MVTDARAVSDLRTSLSRLAADAVLKVACAVERDLDRHAGDYGISDAKLEVLEVLSCCAGRRACLHTLGDRLGVTRPNVTKLVDGLERQGLVRRVPHPEDRRMVQAELTTDGAAMASRALPGRVSRLEGVWGVLDDDELTTLVALLTRAAGSVCTRHRCGPAAAEPPPAAEAD